MQTLNEIFYCKQPIKTDDDSICNIASQFCYINYKINAGQLEEKFHKLDHILAVGVVDNDSNLIGIIVKEQFFSRLSMRFGRELFHRKTVESLMIKPTTFNFSSSINDVSDHLRNEIKSPVIKYYVLIDHNNQFISIFSTSDLLVYLKDKVDIQAIELKKKNDIILQNNKNLKKMQLDLQDSHSQLELRVKQRTEKLITTNAELKLMGEVFEKALEGIIITDTKGFIKKVNKSFEKIYGYKTSELFNKNINILNSNKHDELFYHKMWQSLLKNGFWEGESWNNCKCGKNIPNKLSISSIKNSFNEITHFIFIYNNVSDLINQKEKMKQKAYHDPLTQLPNRYLLDEQMNIAINNAHINQHKLGILFIDLDDFKVINDTQGHNIGDEVLKSVASYFKAVLREKDIISRYGGDEFIIVLDNFNDVNVITSLAQRLIEQLKKPIIINNYKLNLSTSIGIAFYPNDGNDSETLIKKADKAMYTAKQMGKNQYYVYNSSNIDNIKV